ncbi:hypothetical protein SARC_05385 [Sphaeroforma arctica JP610]|uniref:Aquaporin n=1 Tax=Sphaeroforma arctica JP610 TaxID=667725 RepID=A0A0L0G0F2_9EUKA|nr:hypothetical protein SARC_05385 [Sphaeroforma arctica JP610]KNC82321.1 hypothetical protein SARC_05385 [Sphaeroforma arctica JP610]|eukprot:XP_014156223.1 hypothetical protein SARC_05385 [Sphaeroforma arctica JP610]
MGHGMSSELSFKKWGGHAAIRSYSAEFIGMFFFLFVTIGVVCSFYGALAASVEDLLPQVFSGTERQVDPAYQPQVGGKYAFNTAMVLTIAFAFGMSIMVLVFSIAHISGGHLNPAVTMAMICFGKINVIRGIGYIIVQTLGATCGVAMVDALWPNQVTDAVAFGANGYDHNVTSTAQAFFIEFFGTALLVFTIFGTAVDPRGSEFAHHNAPIAIGFAVFLAHIMMIPVTGCGINPARSFASAVVSGSWDDQWLYWVAPLCGGPFGGALNYFAFQWKNNPEDEAGIMAAGAQEGDPELAERHTPAAVAGQESTVGVQSTAPVTTRSK